MISSLNPALAAIFTLLMCQVSLWGGPLPIVENDFAQKGEGDLPLTEGRESKLPFKNPTYATAQPGSTVVLAKEGAGNYKKPAVIFTIGGRPVNPAAAANARLAWDFRVAKLPQGVYELSYPIIPLSASITGGRLQFGLVDPDGALLDFSEASSLSTMPSAFFNNGMFHLGTAGGVKFKEGKAIEVKIQFDVKKQIWSGWLDNKQIVRNQALPDSITGRYKDIFIGTMSIGSEAGSADAPGNSYAIGALKLLQLSK